MMITIIRDGVAVQIDQPQNFSAPSGRVISSAAFLALWTPDEVKLCSADAVLNFQMLMAMNQGTVNLDSPRLPPLLALAVSKGLSADRSAQIAAGTPPA